MQSLRGRAELQVSDADLYIEGGGCESLAGKLAGNVPPAGAGSSELASAAAVNASHAQIAAAGIRCSFRVQATATKLVVAASRYTENETRSAAQVQAIFTPTVS
jgi:glycerate kinase